MDATDLGLDGVGIVIESIELTADQATIVLTPTAEMAACPLCGRPSGRLHGRYKRTLADLPRHGRAVALVLRARRFRCANPECPRAIFCERLPGLAGAHARSTGRLARLHLALGLALGGQPGARLAVQMGITVSPDTLLRRVVGAEEGPGSTPRCVGIDDWAWRKGRRYGTIVVDLEHGRVVDLLPDREEETVRRWLAEHPGVELVSRDRASAYSKAATEAAPRAAQVADRWHLLKNLREAVERIFEREHATIAAALAAPAQGGTGGGSAPEVVPASDGSTSAGAPADAPPAMHRRQAHKARRGRRVERFDRVRELGRAGHSARRIAEEVRVSPTTVRRYLRLGSCPDWVPGRLEPSRLDEHRDWIDGRIAEGCINAARLREELADRGCRMSPVSVRRYVAKRLAAAGEVRARSNAAQPPAPPRPSPKRLAYDWARRPEDREDNQKARLGAIRAGSPALAAALELADGFAELIRKRSDATLSDWLARAESSECPELRRFAEGVRRDEAAIQEAVDGPWSNGQVEGQVNRLKAIKRQMYGRAGFRLLRARVVHVA